MQIRNEAFVKYFEHYDKWFVENPYIYKSELKAFELLDIKGKSIEIGIGTGRFASPLGIGFGVDPTYEMLKRLPDGIHPIKGVAEYLPVKSSSFGWALMVTTICFVTDPLLSIKEMYRILKVGGKAAVGFVDADSRLGKLYSDRKNESKFYREASFYSSDEITNFLKVAGFKKIKRFQTLFGSLDSIKREVQEPAEGSGKGSFIIISGEK